MDIRAVVTTIRITRYPIPVKGSCITQAPNRHCGSRHDLVAPGHHRCFQHPEKLISVSIWMTTRACKRPRRRGCCRVESDSASLHCGMSRILQLNGLNQLWMRTIGNVHARHSIGNCIERPSHPRLATGIRLQRNAPGNRINPNPPKHLTAGRIHGEELV